MDDASTPMRRTIRTLASEERKKLRRQLDDIVGVSGMWPLNAPGMPPPGPNFLRVAQQQDDDTQYVKATLTKEGIYKPGERLEEMYRRALREPGFTIDIKLREGQFKPVRFVPGHIWGQHANNWEKVLRGEHIPLEIVDGPHPAEVMILGKMPWVEEVKRGRNMVSATGEILTTLVRTLHLEKKAPAWYVTNLVKFMPPDMTSRLRADWIHDCMPILHEELRIVRPKYILCLGADASKSLLGKKYNVSYMAGRVVPYSFPVHLSNDLEPETHTAYVMTVLHPAEVSREPSKARILENNFGRFSFLITGTNFDLEEKGLDHRVIDTYEDAEEWVNEVNIFFANRPLKDRLVAWDAEWQGQHPINEGSYLRTVQVSWTEKKAVCFKIAHQGGKTAFRDRDGKPALKRLAKLLNEFMSDKRAVGHFFISDLEWLHHYGIDPIANCQVPLADKGNRLAWMRLRAGEGWLDTGMMSHAIEETGMLGLDVLSMRYTTAPPYYTALDDWKRDYCLKHKIKAQALEGYGDCPDKILIPYANYDADVTLRIAKVLLPLLDKDYEGNSPWEAFWESMIVQKVILRMHKNGILVDRNRADELTRNFITVRASQEDKIQQWAKWPEFNIRSTFQVREFLFGEKLNGKRSKDGQIFRIRPDDARSLYITPLLDTGKPPRRWADLVARKQDKDATPGTSKTVLSILAQDNLNVAEQIGMIRDYRFLDQVLKSVLRHPKTDEEDQWITNDDGDLEYEAGLVASIDSDGRVRTHMSPTAETGRWKHSRPNLANVSKSRDPDYLRLLGADMYKYKLRSLLKAAPGFVFIEADYKGAELYGMALMAGSKRMQDHCVRANNYPEDGYDENGNEAGKVHWCPGDCKKCRKGGVSDKPHVCGGACSLCGYPHAEYYDIHSNVAKLAFQLKCHPSKFGLELIKKAHFRTLAKNVVFGIAYGRGAKAIALQAKEQGVNVTVEQAQQVIDTIFEMYPELLPFFHEAEKRALVDRWLCHCYGRFRRFPSASDYKLEGEFARQAMNFPIQGMIASAVDRGLAWLDDAIDAQNLADAIRLLLQMHDALLLECRYEHVQHAVDLIQWAMVDKVEIWPTTLDGIPRGDGPYHLGVDVSVDAHWGEPISKSKCVEYGIPEKYGK